MLEICPTPIYTGLSKTDRGHKSHWSPSMRASIGWAWNTRPIKYPGLLTRPFVKCEA